jgi:hypothetical protein
MANKYTDPVAQLFLQGRKITTDLTFEENFSVKGKDEHTLVIKNTNGFVPVTYNNIGSLARIIITVTPLTTVTVDPIVTLKFTVNDGMNPIYTIDLPFRKIFYYMPDTVFSAYITNIQLSTSSTTDVEIDFRAYGE